MTPMTSRHIQVPPIRVIICHTYNQVTQQTRAKHNTACAFSISWLLLFCPAWAVTLGTDVYHGLAGHPGVSATRAGEVRERDVTSSHGPTRT